MVDHLLGAGTPGAASGTPNIGGYTQTGRPTKDNGGASFAQLVQGAPSPGRSPAETAQALGSILRTAEETSLHYLQGSADTNTLVRATNEAEQALNLTKSLLEKVVEVNTRMQQMM